jgi:hypothetical protein
MNFIYEKWNNWEVVKCESGKLELIVGISAGPRILSFRHVDHENLLYYDYTNFRVGDWRIYGGHRFTIGPESEESYVPDNAPCDTAIIDSSLSIISERRQSGIQLSLLITEVEACEGFTIEHILTNYGDEDWVGALWAITCIPRSARVNAKCTTSNIHFWPETNPANWQLTVDLVTIKAGDFKGKAGWYSDYPLLTALQSHGTFEITVLEGSSPDKCIDNGSNVEVFVCPDFIELETLSPNLNVPPGTTVQHQQRWIAYPPSLT